jgi:hypothetical protein
MRRGAWTLTTPQLGSSWSVLVEAILLSTHHNGVGDVASWRLELQRQGFLELGYRSLEYNLGGLCLTVDSNGQRWLHIMTMFPGHYKKKSPYPENVLADTSHSRLQKFFFG